MYSGFVSNLNIHVNVCICALRWELNGWFLDDFFANTDVIVFCSTTFCHSGKILEVEALSLSHTPFLSTRLSLLAHFLIFYVCLFIYLFFFNSGQAYKEESLLPTNEQGSSQNHPWISSGVWHWKCELWQWTKA